LTVAFKCDGIDRQEASVAQITLNEAPALLKTVKVGSEGKTP